MAVKTYSAQYWGATYFRPVWFAEAMEGIPLEVEHRPRTNIRLRPIREARVRLSGAAAASAAGTVFCRAPTLAVRAPTAVPGRARGLGYDSSARVGSVTAKGAARGTFAGQKAAATRGVCRGRSGASTRAAGSGVQVRSGGPTSCAGGRASFAWNEGGEAFLGVVSARGVQNPTDEQLAYVAYLLTR